MKQKILSIIELILISGVVIIADQYTKLLVRTNLPLRESITPFEQFPFFRIIHWKNTGVAFGLFQGSGWIFTIVGIVIVILVIIFFRQAISGEFFWRAALALQLGGAFGNLIDRINPELGYVVDFIWIGNFPVFNLADSAIVIGAIIMIIGMWNQEKKDKNNETSDSTVDSGVKINSSKTLITASTIPSSEEAHLEKNKTDHDVQGKLE